MLVRGDVWHLVVGIRTDWPPAECLPLFIDELSLMNRTCCLPSHQEGCGFCSRGSVLQPTLATVSAAETLLLLEECVLFGQQDTTHILTVKVGCSGWWTAKFPTKGTGNMTSFSVYPPVESRAIGLVSRPLWIPSAVTWMRQTSPEMLPTRAENRSRFSFGWTIPLSVAFDCDLPMLFLAQK